MVHIPFLLNLTTIKRRYNLPTRYCLIASVVLKRGCQVLALNFHLVIRYNDYNIRIEGSFFGV